MAADAAVHPQARSPGAAPGADSWHRTAATKIGSGLCRTLPLSERWSSVSRPPVSAAVTQNDSYMVTCEHGGNRIPPRYRALFIGYEALLQTHRGLDPGALTLARELAAALHAPLVASVTSRLLVDLNRSSGHPQLYSQPVRQAPEAV